MPLSSSNNSSELLELAQKISQLTSEVVSVLRNSSLSEPSLSVSSPDVPTTSEYNQLRGKLNDAASDLLLLVNGPKTHARKFFCTHHDLAAYQIAFDYDIFSAVSENDSIGLSQLAEATGLYPDLLSRVMRLLCTQRFFSEISPNTFVHTSVSIIFRNDKQLKAAGDYQLDEMFKAAGDTAAFMRRGTSEENAVISPFQERHGVPLFKYYANNPKLAARFASAMAGVAKLDRPIVELRDGYPWSSIHEGEVVDMGGGSGHISVALLRAFPNLKIVVQDVNKDMLSQAETQDMGDVKGRIRFMQHNFFNEQPVVGAAAYFIRQCLHNWKDEDCVKIFQGLVPALEASKPGTPLLINDTILLEPGTATRFEEHGLRQLDMMMLVALGAKQRTQAEFRHLLELADSRYEIKNVYEGSMGLLEVNLNSNKNGSGATSM